MLLLTSTSDLVNVVTSAASDIQVHASWMDNNSGVITPGRKNTLISTATTTTVVPSPSSGVQRNLRALQIFNSHATVECFVIVQHTDGEKVVELITATLLPNENLRFTEDGQWVHSAANSAGYNAPQGPAGPEGPPGADGPAGPGLAPGGEYMQKLVKASADDYDTMWVDDLPPVEFYTDENALPLIGKNGQLYLALNTGKTYSWFAGDGAYVLVSQEQKWGSITGNLPDQPDLLAALNARALLSGATFTGAITATNLSGTNTGDQDLSGYATTAALTSGLAGKQNTLSAASASVDGYLTAVDWTAFNAKQAALVSGTNIKTVNGNSLLGSGDLSISTGLGGSIAAGQVAYATNNNTIGGDADWTYNSTTNVSTLVGYHVVRQPSLNSWVYYYQKNDGSNLFYSSYDGSNFHNYLGTNASYVINLSQNNNAFAINGVSPTSNNTVQITNATLFLNSAINGTVPSIYFNPTSYATLATQLTTANLFSLRSFAYNGSNGYTISTTTGIKQAQLSANNNDAVIFWEDTNQARLFSILTSSGNFGIRNSVPAGQFDVTNTIPSQPALIIRSASGQSSDIIQVKNSSGANLLALTVSQELIVPTLRGNIQTTSISDNGAGNGISISPTSTGTGSLLVQLRDITGATKPTTIIRQFTGQTSNLLEFQNSANAVMTAINSVGTISHVSASANPAINITHNFNSSVITVAKGASLGSIIDATMSTAQSTGFVFSNIDAGTYLYNSFTTGISCSVSTAADSYGNCGAYFSATTNRTTAGTNSNLAIGIDVLASSQITGLSVSGYSARFTAGSVNIIPLFLVGANGQTADYRRTTTFNGTTVEKLTSAGLLGINQSTPAAQFDVVNSNAAQPICKFTGTSGSISQINNDGTITATNLSGTNTGDETTATIKTKLGAVSTAADGYLTAAQYSAIVYDSFSSTLTALPTITDASHGLTYLLNLSSNGTLTLPDSASISQNITLNLRFRASSTGTVTISASGSATAEGTLTANSGTINLAFNRAANLWLVSP